MPDTIYHYRLAATNGAGTATSVDRTFRTAAVPDKRKPKAKISVPKTQRIHAITVTVTSDEAGSVLGTATASSTSLQPRASKIVTLGRRDRAHHQAGQGQGHDQADQVGDQAPEAGSQALHQGHRAHHGDRQGGQRDRPAQDDHAEALAGYSQRRVRGVSRMRISRAGTPPITALAGTSWVTTAVVPRIALSPTVTPRRMHTP